MYSYCSSGPVANNSADRDRSNRPNLSSLASLGMVVRYDISRHARGWVDISMHGDRAAASFFFFLLF